MEERLNPVGWIASSRKDLRSLPEDVRRVVGVALFRAQQGKKHAEAKPLQAFGGAGVLEVVASHDSDAFRAVYTVQFAEMIYVLHCFQKESKSGTSTPKQELDLIRARLKLAEEEYKIWKTK